MKEYEKSLKKEIMGFVLDKKSSLKQLKVSTFKILAKELKRNKDYKIEMVDVESYREIKQTRINTVRANIQIEKDRNEIKPVTHEIYLRDAMNLLVRYIKTDINSMLNFKFFDEDKVYKLYSKRMKNDKVLYDNLMFCVKEKEDIVNMYFKFVMDLMRQAPSIIKELREGEEK